MKNINWYVVKNGSIIKSCNSEKEAGKIIENDMTGTLEIYPATALVKNFMRTNGRNKRREEL